AVTAAFFFLLKLFDTPNLLFSTISITTSFMAAALTLFRSAYYGLFYAANDIVLIILWALASAEDASYLSMVICFACFLINDLYGFLNWQRMKSRQAADHPL
nr:nicotinamide mononucleotide transporter family protein [Eubacterium sp.]